MFFFPWVFLFKIYECIFANFIACAHLSKISKEKSVGLWGVPNDIDEATVGEIRIPNELIHVFPLNIFDRVHKSF